MSESRQCQNPEEKEPSLPTTYSDRIYYKVDDGIFVTGATDEESLIHSIKLTNFNSNTQKKILDLRHQIRSIIPLDKDNILILSAPCKGRYEGVPISEWELSTFNLSTNERIIHKKPDSKNLQLQSLFLLADGRVGFYTFKAQVGIWNKENNTYDICFKKLGASGLIRGEFFPLPDGRVLAFNAYNQKPDRSSVRMPVSFLSIPTLRGKLSVLNLTEKKKDYSFETLSFEDYRTNNQAIMLSDDLIAISHSRNLHVYNFKTQQLVAEFRTPRLFDKLDSVILLPNNILACGLLGKIMFCDLVSKQKPAILPFGERKIDLTLLSNQTMRIDDSRNTYLFDFSDIVKKMVDARSPLSFPHRIVRFFRNCCHQTEAEEKEISSALQLNG